jgi:DNA-binding protein HU-beta
MAKKPATKRAAPTRAKKPAARRAPRAKAAPTAAKSSPSSSLKVTATPAGTSDRDHLMAVVQAGTGASKKAAKETLDAMLDTISSSLKKNSKFQLVGFGAFEVSKRPARKGRNPRTGEQIRIKASKSVRFKAGAGLKSKV